MPLARRSLSLFLLSTALVAAAQTATHPKARTTTPAKSTQPALPKNIPPVTAPMKTQYVMRYQDIKVGTGDLAEPGWVYSVHYTGWLASDGTKFDSSSTAVSRSSSSRASSASSPDGIRASKACTWAASAVSSFPTSSLMEKRAARR